MYKLFFFFGGGGRVEGREHVSQSIHRLPWNWVDKKIVLSWFFICSSLKCLSSTYCEFSSCKICWWTVFLCVCLFVFVEGADMMYSVLVLLHYLSSASKGFRKKIRHFFLWPDKQNLLTRSTKKNQELHPPPPQKKKKSKVKLQICLYSCSRHH